MAALLLEGISGIQYLMTRQQMANELEKRAESELTLKAILIKSNMNDAEALFICVLHYRLHLRFSLPRQSSNAMG